MSPPDPALGAPGVLFAPPEPVRELEGIRRDVAAFLGVAPRGPAWLPPETLEPDTDIVTWLATTRRRRSIPAVVSSWDEYRRVFGGFEGPGRLPYAVSAFFAAGGTRAHVVRVVHEHPDRLADAQGRASGVLDDGQGQPLLSTGGSPLRWWARDEGRWGNAVRVTLRFTTRPLTARALAPDRLEVDTRDWVPQGTLLRLTDGADTAELRFVTSSVEEAVGAGRRRVVTLDAGVASPERVEVVTGELLVVDHDRAFARREVLTDLGLSHEHPRWLARAVVLESRLVWPDRPWVGSALLPPDPALPPLVLLGEGAAPPLAGGEDRWATIVPDDFWDTTWTPGDEHPGDGVQCLAELEDVGLVVAPDLYEPSPLAPSVDVTDPPTLCGPEFEVHVGDPGAPPPEAPPAPGLDGLALDPRVPGDLARVVSAQQALVSFADQQRAHTLLLDAPLGLTHRQLLSWRSAFDSPYVAAYHPWLDTATPEDHRESLVRVNPSAYAAGIIAERERRLGVQHGPANQVAVGAFRLAEPVPRPEHDELHLSGINVFVAEPRGIVLTGARTLSRGSALRQLSVARLMTVLRLTLEREMQWAAFEPHGEGLWAEVTRLVRSLLARLFEAGAFRGATTKEAFFVRCDRTTMTPHDIDSGRVVCLVGVAPAEPVEYLLLEVALAATTGVRVEVRG